MKAVFLAAIGLAMIAAPQAIARDIIYVGQPAPQQGFFPQSAVWPLPELMGGADRVAPHATSQARIITVSPRRISADSGIRIFRGSSVTELGRSGTATADPVLTGKTVVRLKKPPRNPYKTVIVYAPRSAREVRAQRNPD